MFAFGLVAFGFLGMGPVTIAVDSYGPVTDNAQSVYELSHDRADSRHPAGAQAGLQYRRAISTRAKDLLEENDGAGNTFKATAKPVLIGTAVVGATTMIFSIIMALTNGITENVDKLSLLHAPFLLGLITGGAMIYWFTGASTQAVTTGAYRAVEFIKANIKLESVEKASVADSKKVVEICTQYAQKGMLNIFIAVFFATLAFAFVEPFFFVGYLISIAIFGLYQAIFMANAGGAWDNAKKIVEVELKQKGTELHAATVVGDTVGDPFKDTSSVALNPVIKFTTLFGLLAVELAVRLTAETGGSADARPGGGLLPDLFHLRLPLVLQHAHPRRAAGGEARHASPTSGLAPAPIRIAQNVMRAGFSARPLFHRMIRSRSSAASGTSADHSRNPGKQRRGPACRGAPKITSPSTERKSVVSVRSRPSLSCSGPRPGHLP